MGEVGRSNFTVVNTLILLCEFSPQCTTSNPSAKNSNADVLPQAIVELNKSMSNYGYK